MLITGGWLDTLRLHLDSPSEAQVLWFSVFVGLTILPGVLLGRRIASGWLPLRAVSCGVLIYLFADLLAKAFEPVNSALLRRFDYLAGSGLAIEQSVLFIGGLALGYGGLAGYLAFAGRGEASLTTLRPSSLDSARHRVADQTTPSSHRLVGMLAVGIGLYNFCVGLALGDLANNGWLSVSIALAVGYLLQNLVLGSTLAGPIAGVDRQPHWSFLLFTGLAVGAPTVLGTYLGWLVLDVVGQVPRADLVDVGYRSVSAGAILFVLVQLLTSAGGLGTRASRHFWLLAGMAIASVTEILIIGATGA